MNSSLKNKLLQEIDRIPEDKLVDLYNFVHYFRLGVEKTEMKKPQPTMAFAGCWQDMADELFTDFMTDITQRRRQAFSRRRDNEALTD